MPPHFISIGEQKAGTSWLYDQLCHHPEFAMPPVKELHYFDQIEQRGEPVRLRRKQDVKDLRRRVRRARVAGPQIAELGISPNRKAAVKQFRRAIRRHYVADKTHSWYRSLFGPDGITGDITPGYSSVSDDMIYEIHDQFPDVKLVQLVRDPVSRAWSAWRMRARKRGLSEEKTYRVGRIRRYLTGAKAQGRSNPASNHHRWERAFGADAIHVETLDRIRREPEAARADIALFLGATDPHDSWRLPADFNRKVVWSGGPMSDEIRDFLNEFYAEEMRQYRDLFEEKG